MIAIIGITIASLLFMLNTNTIFCIILATVFCTAEYMPYMKGDKNDN